MDYGAVIGAGLRALARGPSDFRIRASLQILLLCLAGFLLPVLIGGKADADTLDWATRPTTDLLTATDSVAVNGVTIQTSGGRTGGFNPNPPSNGILPTSSANGSGVGIIASQMDATAGDGTSTQTIKFNFSEPVYNLTIVVRDIDGGPTCTCNFTDQVNFTSDAGLPTSFTAASGVTYNSATGTAIANQNIGISDTTGNMTVTFAGPVTSATVTHVAAANNNVTDPSFQLIVIDDLTWTASPRVTVSKISNGGTGTFSFTGNNGFTAHDITTATAGTSVSGPQRSLATQNVATTLTESAPPAGFALTGISCAGLGSGAATPDLANRKVTLGAAAIIPGATIACTFTNTRATVKFQKQSNGGTATFSFNTPVNIASTPASINTATANPGPAAPTPISVTTLGSQVQLTEAAVAGFGLAGFSCSDANSAVTGNTGTFGTFDAATRVVTIPAANVKAGADISCLITNSRTTVKFQKQSIGGTTTFSFTTPVNIASAPGNINTATSNPGPAAPTAINVTAAGSQVQLTETAVAGYAMTGFSCTDANSAVTGNTGTFGSFNSSTRVVTIPAANVKAGADITCLISNTRATVKFRKQSNGGTASFSFSTPVNIASAPATIDTSVSNPGPASPAAINVTTVGSQVQLTETTVTGYAITGFACTDSNSAVSGNPANFNGTFNASTGVVTIPNTNVVAGADLTCTITNTKTPTVKFRKQSFGGTASFSFNTPVNIASAPTAIDTAASNPGPASPAAINVSAVGSQVQVTEAAVAGYAMTAFNCTDANSAVTGNSGTFGTFNSTTRVVTIPAVNVVAGADITCLIANTRPTVKFKKQSIGGTASFSFNTPVNITSAPAAIDTSISNPGPVSPASINVTTVGSQVQLTEAAVAGYAITGFTCTDANSAVSGNAASFNGTFNASTRVVTVPSANIVAGADLTCTVTNTRTPTVKFKKQSLGGTASFSFSTPVNIASAPAAIDTSVSNPGPAAPSSINITTIGSQVQLTEAAVSGYVLTGFACTDANSAASGNPASFGGTFDASTRVLTIPSTNIVAGADLTCSITNTKLPSITLTKISNGGTGAFSFTGTNGFGLETITTLSAGGSGTNGSSHVLSAASAATDITETAPPGSFVLALISCSGLSSGGSQTVNLAARKVSLDAAATAPGANIACIFTNGIPGLSVAKTGTLNDGGDGVANAGDTISYSFTVTNTGTVTLTNVSASDPGAVLSGGPIASLAPSAVDSTTITGVHTLTQAEIDSGSYANSVTITANPPTGPPVTANDTETVTLPSMPAFTVVKAQTAGPNPITSLPATLSYKITVKNTGNRTLTAPVISDSLIQGSNSLTLTSGPTLTSGDTDSDNALDTAEAWIYTATYAVTQANLDHGGNIVNSATFDSAETAPLTSAPVATPITQTPGLTIVKSASTAGPVAVNDVITYTYKVTNTGNVTIHGVTVNDTHNGYGTPPVPGGETILNDQTPTGDSTDAAVNASWDVLAPGDSIKFTSTYTVTQADVDLLQ